MLKCKRRWVKNEKRIIKLLYSRGLIEQEISELYWNAYLQINNSPYLPQVHFCVTDYWGEADEHSVTDSCFEGIYWELRGELDHLPKDQKISSQQAQIKYLKALPRRIFNSKINKVTNRMEMV